jgi:uncharacterized protein
MKLHRDTHSGLNTVTGYGDGYVVINQQRYEEGIVVLPTSLVPGWGASGFAALTPADIVQLSEMKPEIVLLGTGARQQFPEPALLLPLIEARIGFEVMDTQAACRTYNILMSEGRNVAAALLLC